MVLADHLTASLSSRAMQGLGRPQPRAYRGSMLGFIIILLVLWLALSVLGFVIEGLFWLAIAGIVLFLATAVWGWLQRKDARDS